MERRLDRASIVSTTDPDNRDYLVEHYTDPEVVTADSVPPYLLQDGIKYGYRVNHPPSAAMRSICSVHNESVNVWTHFIALWVFLSWFIFIFDDRSVSSLARTDILVLGIYAAGVLLSLLCSSILHLFNCYTLRYKNALCRLDHFGILVLLMSSDVPMVYFGLSCWPDIRRIYLIILPVVVGIGMFVILSTWMQDDRNLKWRLLAFVSVVSYGVIHMAHECHLRGGLSSADGRRVFLTWLAVFSMYGVGISFYASGFPERCTKSSRFDYIGASHQLWHIFTILGGAIHVYAVLMYLEESFKCYLLHV